MYPLLTDNKNLKRGDAHLHNYLGYFNKTFMYCLNQIIHFPNYTLISEFGCKHGDILPCSNDAAPSLVISGATSQY